MSKPNNTPMSYATAVASDDKLSALEALWWALAQELTRRLQDTKSPPRASTLNAIRLFLADNNFTAAKLRSVTTAPMGSGIAWDRLAQSVEQEKLTGGPDDEDGDGDNNGGGGPSVH